MLDKKLKAAIAGVLQFLQQEKEQSKKKKTNQWVLSGRKMIMKNNQLVQRREFNR
ncbi:MAG: hypothetical protein K9N09_03550 [Candidatus Cloacimonetes bacterium]|nr:hypothetical protein [Candidatus Cloacimonadota bacterium]MCF7813460.1 hypothetical protein [Candidatus Cloacimonadota bacterium]MCF7867753.1 hypothetical protein [Candidatus Cloacimonadota bacterium]MCF7883161.1 hypothetical protein [Candidatus Cloacimonadota bacterium]